MPLKDFFTMMDDMGGAGVNACFALVFAILGFAFTEHEEKMSSKKAP